MKESTDPGCLNFQNSLPIVDKGGGVIVSSTVDGLLSLAVIDHGAMHATIPTLYLAATRDTAARQTLIRLKFIFLARLFYSKKRLYCLEWYCSSYYERL